MLSRPKLVQDWNRRLAAAEAEGAQKHSLKWLYQMRVRLYRFLLSCYRQQDWRADKPSTLKLTGGTSFPGSKATLKPQPRLVFSMP